MPGIYLQGWDSVNEVWVKIECDANGKLKIDPALILENPPTEDEDKKAPTSEWAFDHKADVGAHHTKYTDAESRAAINDLFNSSGVATKDLLMNEKRLKDVMVFELDGRENDDSAGVIYYTHVGRRFYMYGIDDNGTTQNTVILLKEATGWNAVCTQVVADTKISTHAAISDAHHAKYTDLEAQTACNLAGNLYWSCSGLHFDSKNPDTDQVYKSTNGYVKAEADNISFLANVDLPDGATVTGCIVYGNAAAEAETWVLVRITLSGGAHNDMANDSINSEDTSISYDTIDNSLYAYFLVTSSFDTDDLIYGAHITYTL